MSSRTAWIIGASSGLGRALALHLASNGWQVAISARREAPLAEMVKQCGNGPGRLVAVPLDVTDAESRARARLRVTELVGPVAHCFLNAAFYEPAGGGGFKAGTYHRHMAVNYLGVVNALEAVLDESTGTAPACIYVTASVAGYRGLPNAAPYGASKAALINLCESLRGELARRGVELRVIAPGFIKTPATDKNSFEMPFIITAEEGARRIYRAIGGSSFEITFPRRFTYLLKLLRMLPYRLYFPLIGKLVSS